MLSALVSLLLVQGTREFGVLGIRCVSDAMPKELDLMVVVGAGSAARFAQWHIVDEPPVTFEVIDLMSPPPNVTRHALTRAQWPEFSKQLEFPPSFVRESLESWRTRPVRVQVRKRCPNQKEERFGFAIEQVESRTNERLLAAAVKVIRLVEPTFGPAFEVPDAGAAEKTTGFVPPKERSP